MAGKVVINLATGLEDAERVTVAFLVGGAAVEQGKTVTMFLTKEAVRLALPGYGNAVACDGCPPLERLLQQYADGGGELLVCPICFSARKLDDSQLAPNARLGGATPLWEWIGEEPATVFSYWAWCRAGLANIQIDEGPFEMMTPKGVRDEGVTRSLSVMGACWRPACAKKMAWLMPRMRRAVPYLGYIVVSGEKPK